MDDWFWVTKLTLNQGVHTTFIDISKSSTSGGRARELLQIGATTKGKS
jgi:hypothetical protein